MHIHILGICGTFMGGIAAIARQANHHVTGCDANVYPPMSTQLAAQGIDLIEGYSPTQLEQFKTQPDLFLIGNAISRGNPLMEAILNRGLPYTSGPQWLGEQVLNNKHVLAIAGTHGKTTTTAMLTWILEFNQLHPGYLIGGVPLNFPVSASLGGGKYFVIEADEYDTAFFDKRSKFVHYRPRTAVLNNLEYDHADIFPDLNTIQTQFHHLVRTVPGDGMVVMNGAQDSLQNVIERGCWSSLARFGDASTNLEWTVENVSTEPKQEVLAISHLGNRVAELVWGANSGVMGQHNQMNALAAIIAAQHIGIAPSDSVKALAEFRNVKRRLELIGIEKQIFIYDDFAHHPTAIQTTIEGLRKKVGNQRILAVIEPRSNTMKLGVMKAQLPNSLLDADFVFAYGAASGKDALGWDLAEALQPLGKKAVSFDNLEAVVNQVCAQAQAGDHILVMSNGGFGGIHQKIVNKLKNN